MSKRAATNLTERAAIPSDSPEPSQPDALTSRQRAFVEEYLRTGNGTQSAIKAGYSARSASTTASVMLRNERIRDALRGRQLRRARMADVNAASVLAHAQRLAMYDVRQLFDAAGNLLPVQEWPDDVAAAVQGIEVTGGVPGLPPRVSMKLADKGQATDRLMRHLGMFEADNRQGADALGQMLAAIHGQGSLLPVKP